MAARSIPYDESPNKHPLPPVLHPTPPHVGRCALRPVGVRGQGVSEKNRDIKVTGGNNIPVGPQGGETDEADEMCHP